MTTTDPTHGPCGMCSRRQVPFDKLGSAHLCRSCHKAAYKKVKGVPRTTPTDDTLPALEWDECHYCGEKEDVGVVFYLCEMCEEVRLGKFFADRERKSQPAKFVTNEVGNCSSCGDDSLPTVELSNRDGELCTDCFKLALKYPLAVGAPNSSSDEASSDEESSED